MSFKLLFKKIINPVVNEENKEKSDLNKKSLKIFKEKEKKIIFKFINLTSKNKNMLNPNIFYNIDDKFYKKYKNYHIIGLENYLSLVSQMYYCNNTDIKKSVLNYIDTNNSQKNNVTNVDDILTNILNPTKKYFSYENWSLEEIANFELSICKFGKNYKIISKNIITKSTKEVIEFYNMWKMTSHYKIWKINKNKLKIKFIKIWL